MSLKANYHTHNKLCNHAIGDSFDYVKKAIEVGMKEIGLSDHDPVPAEWMSKEDYDYNWIERNMKLDQFYNIYLKELDSVTKEYGNQIKILKGLECEYIPGHDEYYQELKSHLDYLNLGVHFFYANGRVMNSYADLNPNTVMLYANAAVEAMNTGMFKILVHPDLFMFGYKNKDGKREFDEACSQASKIIIEAAIKNNMYLELNCNGIANSRKYNSTSWLYPDRNFWEIAKTYKDAKMIIGADAHNPDALDNEDVAAVEAFVKELGLKVAETIEL